MGATRRRVQVKRDTMEIVSWFIEPVPPSTNSSLRGPVRVWGSARDGRQKVRWWRSSSIQQRISSTMLKTRFGTFVKLKGAICEEYARKLMMTSDAIHSFRRGFPARWQTLLPESFSPDVFRQKLNEPRPSKGNVAALRAADTGMAPKPQLRCHPHSHNPANAHQTRAYRGGEAGNVKQQPQRKSTRRKSVAFADVHNDSTAYRKQEENKIQSDSKNSKENADSASANKWSESQIASFERQRNSIPADDVQYWDSISSRVQGKSAEDCRSFWESTWSPPKPRKSVLAAKRSTHGSGRGKPRAGTPDVLMDLQKGANLRRRSNSTKFRSQVRQIAEVIAREVDDDALEPSINTPKAADGNLFKTDVSQIPALAAEGTPGTEVRKKRASVEEQRAVETPEILARGRTFGLREADHYITLFKRRAAATKPVEQHLKQSNCAYSSG